MSETGSERLGWLGTGRMGVAMVERLLAGQSDVTVWNRTRAKCEPLEANGAEVADSISELASADVVFVMVSTSADLKVGYCARTTCPR
jgi:3-hydroxyisobutyrate dehydrogenase